MFCSLIKAFNIQNVSELAYYYDNATIFYYFINSIDLIHNLKQNRSPYN